MIPRKNGRKEGSWHAELARNVYVYVEEIVIEKEEEGKRERRRCGGRRSKGGRVLKKG